MPNYQLLRQIDICSAAELPEKLGMDENAIYVHEGSRFPSAEDAQKSCAEIEALHGNPGLLVLEALVPKLPSAVARNIEDYRAKLPKLREKYLVLRELDPVTGAESWKQNMQAEIIARTKAGKSKSEKGNEKLKTCDGCNSRINIAHIEDYLCPVCKVFPFMETNTDAKVMSNRELRLKEYREEIEQADQTMERMEAQGSKEATDFKRAWLAYEKLQEVAAVPTSEPQDLAPVGDASNPQEVPQVAASGHQDLAPEGETDTTAPAAEELQAAGAHQYA